MEDYQNIREVQDFASAVASIKVLGVGGAGNNAVNQMVESGVKGVEFWVLNTDKQALLSSKVENQITLGEDITNGLGAGAEPEVGRKAAEASIDQIKQAISGADMVFIAAGMGGGTGTGAAPVVARICKEKGILTVGIVTRPFTFEGKKRNQHAVEGLQTLRPYVDSLIVVSNDKLLQMNGNLGLGEAFKLADNILTSSVSTISEVILSSLKINLDFADIRTIMKDKGTALIGMGVGRGEHRAREAASQAVSSPLLECSIKGAKNAIINVVGGKNMSLIDVNEAVEIVRDASGDPDINLIFGTNVIEEMDDEMKVIVIATDFAHGDVHKVEHTSDIENQIHIDKFDMEDIIDTQVEDSKEEENKDENNDDSTSSFIPSFLRRR